MNIYIYSHLFAGVYYHILYTDGSEISSREFFQPIPISRFHHRTSLPWGPCGSVFWSQGSYLEVPRACIVWIAGRFCMVMGHTVRTSHGHQDLEEKHGSCEGMMKHPGGFWPWKCRNMSMFLVFAVVSWGGFQVDDFFGLFLLVVQLAPSSGEVRRKRIRWTPATCSLTKGTMMKDALIYRSLYIYIWLYDMFYILYCNL